MADQMYDVSSEQRALIEERAKRRAVLRNEFQKLAWDPHRHAAAEGGHVFDPAIQRFMAMNATHYDHFKTTPRTLKVGLLGLVLPIVGFAYIFHFDRSRREAKYRNGEVAYKDRQFKLI